MFCYKRKKNHEELKKDGNMNRLWPQKGHRVIRGHRSLWPTLWPQRSRWHLWSVWPSWWPKNVMGSFEVAVSLLTPKVNLTFDLDLGYDPKRSRGHKRSRWPTLWPPKVTVTLWSVWPSLWPLKVTGSLKVAVTYFMTPKVTVTFVVGLT